MCLERLEWSSSSVPWIPWTVIYFSIFAIGVLGHELSWSSNPDGLDPDPMGPMAHLARVLTEDGTPVEAPKKLPGIPMSPTRSLTSNDLK